jgi:hypothetical protein
MKSGKLKRFFDKCRSSENAYRYAFTVPWLLLYVAVTVFLAVMQSSMIPFDQVKTGPPTNLPRI